MVNNIINRLKEGSIKNVVLFSDNVNPPSPPYVVVKPEYDNGNESMRVRIFAHAEQGHYDLLEKYITEELSGLLKRHRMNSRMERGRNERYGAIADNDDKTISMERVFVFPQRLI